MDQHIESLVKAEDRCNVESPEFTILMPCLNEEKTVGGCVKQAILFFLSAGIDGEVIVVDNGSQDDSRRLASQAGATVVHAPNPGYGAALLVGINSAKSSYIIMGDADASYDFSNLTDFINELRGGADLVIGNRFKGGIEVGAMPLLHRYLGNPVLSFVGRLFFRIPIYDFHCGLRGFPRDRIRELGLVTTGMEFASEMIAKSALAGHLIVEVPTVLRPDGRGRASHLRTWRDGWRHLLFMLLFCPRWLFLFPGMALLGVGFAGFITFACNGVLIANLHLGIHSLLYMAASIVLGQQLIQMAFLTKWVGVMSYIVPSPPWLNRFARYFNVETGLVVGVALLTTGLVMSLHLFLDWGDSGYGIREPTEIMRQAIPAVTLMICGVQVAVGALFAGVLNFSIHSFRGRPKK